MKNTQASTSPTSTATVRSKTTVSTKVPTRMVRYCGLKLRSRRELVPLAHVPGHEHQDAGQRGQRHVHRQRRGQQHHRQQRQRMHDAGDRRGRAGAHVGDGARDRAGGRNAAEEGRDEVGHALAHQLLVRVVARELGGVVGHARAQQRLDGAEQRDGDRRDEQLLGAGPAQLRQRKGRQRLRDAAEARADGLHRQLQQRDQHRGRRPAR